MSIKANTDFLFQIKSMTTKCLKESNTDAFTIMRKTCDGKEAEAKALHQKMHECMGKNMFADPSVQARIKKMDGMSEAQKKQEGDKFMKEMRMKRMRTMKCRSEIMKQNH